MSLCWGVEGALGAAARPDGWCEPGVDQGQVVGVGGHSHFPATGMCVAMQSAQTRVMVLKRSLGPQLCTQMRLQCRQRSIVIGRPPVSVAVAGCGVAGAGGVGGVAAAFGGVLGGWVTALAGVSAHGVPPPSSS